ncbi:MAG: PH domain-containing protein [Candidatus Hydrothermales bacterium]
MEWRVWLLAEHKLKGILVSLLVLLVSFLIFISFGKFFSFLSLLILVSSLSNFFFPIKYKIDNDKIVVEKPFWRREISLKEIKRVEKIKAGIFVSPYKKSGILDNFRGLIIITKEKDTVYGFIEKARTSHNT